MDEKEIRKLILFTIATEKGCLGINPTKETKDLYYENYRTLKKEILDDRRWRNLPCSLIGRINIVKWLYYQK
jgi:hypothetical protein